MNDLFIGLGTLLAIVGPLFLVPIIWALYRYVLLRTVGSRTRAFIVAAGVVALILAATYFPGRRRFDRMCEELASPMVTDRVRVQGFYRTSMFPYEAVMYLKQDGFLFVEAPDPFQEGVMLRYSVAQDGSVRHEKAEKVQSEYGVRITYGLKDGVAMTQKIISEIETGREIARATELEYEGGPLAVLLGTFGMSSCPDLLSPVGAREFRMFYDLEGYVLGGKELPVSLRPGR
ncbi:MAG: hypothetical protein H6509_06945 [Bryobacterales bacterium]|nr:hypothetical protein [Acidobacteriota bacterium]MCB9384334.1 hypothetical protein [Bryobacterales bacterium]